MALSRLLFVLALSFSVAIACQQFDKVVTATGDWALDSFNVTGTKAWDASEPLGVMHLGENCVYELTVSNLIPNTKYSWKVTIGGTWEVAYGCEKNAAACTFVPGASGEVKLLFDASTLTLSAEIVPPHLANRATLSCAGGNRFCFTNNCGATYSLIFTANGGAVTNYGSFGHGGTIGVNAGAGFVGNFKLGLTGLSLFEINLDAWSNLDFYDISYIVGFDRGLKVVPPNGGETLDCPTDACVLAYHQSSNSDTHTCTTGGEYQVTWCPSS